MINRTLLLLSILFLFKQCANIQTPIGGAKDVTPPKILSVSPDSGALNVRTQKITFTFDEYVTVQNLNAQLIISPPLKEPYTYIIKGKKLILNLNQKLDSNTTYQYNFGDAIADNNEGNILSNYALVFSTGSHLDSLVLKGKVKDLLSGDPVPNCIVMLYENYTDSSLLKDRPYYITRTTDSGYYYFKHLKAGSFHLVALNDKNKNYRLDPNEQVGFYKNNPVVPASQSIDMSVVEWVPSVPLKLKDQSTTLPGTYRLVFNRPLLPLEEVNLRINYFDHYKKPHIPQHLTDTRDTFLFYLAKYTDTSTVRGLAIIGSDSFPVNIKPKYFKPGRKTETIQKETFALPGPEGVTFKYSRPVLNISKERSHLIKDSIEIANYEIIPGDIPSEFIIKYPFDGQTAYAFIMDSAFLTDFYGIPSDVDTVRLKVQSENNLGNLFINVERADTVDAPLFFQLIKSNKVYREDVIESNSVLDIKYHNIGPGTYSFRYYYDLNKNKQWDGGNILQNIQPEPLILYPKKTEIRTKWTIEDVFILIK